MQILPETFIEKAESILESTPAATPTGDTFARELKKSLQATGGQPLRGSAEEQDADPFMALVQAPYNPTPEIPSPFTPQPVRFTPTEVDKLIAKLKADGVPAKALNALEEMAATPGGATLDMLVEAARQALGGRTTVLNKQDQAQLDSLAQKIMGEDGKDFQKLLSEGTPKEIMTALMSRIKSGDDTVTVSKEEMNALLTTLDVPESTSKAIMRVFGDEASLTMPAKKLAFLLEPAELAVTKTAEDLATLQNSLEKNVPTVMRDASKREEMERMAGMREDRAVAQTRTLIKDTVTQAMPGRDDAPEQDKQTRTVAQKPENKAEQQGEQKTVPTEGQNPVQTGKRALEHHPGQNSTRQAAHAAQNVQAAPDDTKNVRTSAAASQPDASARPYGAVLAGAVAAHEKSGDSGEFGKNSKEDLGRESRFGRTASHAADNRETGTTDVRNAGNSNSMFATIGQGVGTVSPQATPSAQPQAASGSALSSRAMEQVEQAILTTSKNGMQRLEVALNPVELGAMTVTLTTRNGEISALIQPDRAETSQLIIQQVEQIKAHLENQGFRVDKVEVQTHLADQNGQNWQGAEQHNATREQAARTLEWERLRRLGRGSAESSTNLAHDMQFQSRAATVAGQGMHLVA